jgi:hypothetical protein
MEFFRRFVRIGNPVQKRRGGRQRPRLRPLNRPGTTRLVKNSTVYHFVYRETRFSPLALTSTFSRQTKSPLI